MSKRQGIYATTAVAVLVLIVAIVCLNIVAARVFTRADITSDRIYSLSPGTRTILQELKEPVAVKFYFSSSSKALPVVFKTYAARVEEVLNEYAALSGGKLTVEAFDPKPDTDEEEWARKYGINGVRLADGGEVYFGAVFLLGKKELPIPYFDPRREEFLEYDISEILVQIQAKAKGKIGIMSSLSIMGAPAPMMPAPGQEGAGQPWIFVEQLRRSFEVQEVPLTGEKIPEDLNVLMVFHPKNFSDEALYAIDQFVMGGGRLFVAVDPMSRVDLSQASPMARMSGQMPQVHSDLKVLLGSYGVAYEAGKVVGDLNGMMQVNAGGVNVAYPYFVNVREGGVKKDSVITRNLNHMMIGEGGAFSKQTGSEYEFIPLLETSADSGTAEGIMATMMNPADFARQLKPDGQKRVLAAMVTGEFASAFKDGPPAAAKAGGEHLAKSKAKTSVVMIADTDFIYDHNAVELFRFGPQTVMRPSNNNLAFVQNTVEFLGGNQNLISIRSRGKISRPFTKVEELQKTAQIRWQKEEERLSEKLSSLQKKLNDLQGARADGSRMTLTGEQQQEIARFRQEEVEVMRARREVRKNLREDIEKLGSALVVTNMAAVPLVVGIFGVWVFSRRSRRMKGSRK